MTAQQSLSQFFHDYFVPVCILDASSRNMEGYRRAIKLWIQITGDPPLADIRPLTIGQFRLGLEATRHRGELIGSNTVLKHMRHINAVLRRAGPPGSKCQDAAGLIDVVPWARPPRKVESWRQPVPREHVAAVWDVLDHATEPIDPIDGTPPPDLWRAMLSSMLSTALRIGQLNQVPMSAIRAKPIPMLLLPAKICRKSRYEEPHPLHPTALIHLAKVRGRRERLFPMFGRGILADDIAVRHNGSPCKKTQFYREWNRLLELAEVPKFGFHDIRRLVITELSTIDPAAAQLAAGHSTYKMTQRYQGLSIVQDAIGRLPIDEITRNRSA